MWIVTNTGFVSVVEDCYDKSYVIIRSRQEAHLNAFCDIREGSVGYSPTADYQWRIRCKKTEFAELLMRQAFKVDYSNFKNSIKDDDMKRFAGEVWNAGYRNLDSRA